MTHLKLGNYRLFVRAYQEPVIADHNNQGFDAMKGVEVGDYAVISQIDGSYVLYLCTRICYDGRSSDCGFTYYG